jgi:hypothetical protein
MHILVGYSRLIDTLGVYYVFILNKQPVYPLILNEQPICTFSLDKQSVYIHLS